MRNVDRGSRDSASRLTELDKVPEIGQSSPGLCTRMLPDAPRCAVRGGAGLGHPEPLSWGQIRLDRLVPFGLL